MTQDDPITIFQGLDTEHVIFPWLFLLSKMIHGGNLDEIEDTQIYCSTRPGTFPESSFAKGQNMLNLVPHT